MLADAQNLPRVNQFYPEARLPFEERSQLNDFKRSGWSRGHMTPAGDMSTPEGKSQSFSLANVVPQDSSHNRGVWSKIEQDTRRYVRRAKGDVFVITGPLFGKVPQTIGEDKVRVPGSIYKVALDSSTGKNWVHWHTNSAEKQALAPFPMLTSDSKQD